MARQIDAAQSTVPVLPGRAMCKKSYHTDDSAWLEESMPLRCENCGHNEFRLRRAEGGAQAECSKCGRIIPNSVLRAATKQLTEGGVQLSEDDGPI